MRQSDVLVRAAELREELRYRIHSYCRVPPAGWFCSREPGHTGPCAARPVFVPDGSGRNR